MKFEFDCVVIGGGAAGLMCAASVGHRGKRVKVLDHANKVGKKILMSGGGRCNFTNYYIEPENYLSQNPHFCKSALSRYTQYDFLEFVDKYQIHYHEKTLGQLFCNHKAKEILGALISECQAAKVDIETKVSILSIDSVGSEKTNENVNGEIKKAENFKKNIRFKLQTTSGEYNCRSLVVATGGLSIPTMGATGFGYDIAKKFGLSVTPTRASLVPFVVKGALLRLFSSLAGIAVPVTVECNQQKFSESILFTHKGMSGPAVLQISNYWHPGDILEINFLPGESLKVLFDGWHAGCEKASLKNLLSRYLPKRFVIAWLNEKQVCDLQDKSIAQFSKIDIERLSAHFHEWKFFPSGTEGYKTAEVTAGGVQTDEVSSKTFESLKVPGLFFIGEVLDVTGWLGGYNFQWAWASAFCAAQFIE